jgi:hypothetical protein
MTDLLKENKDYTLVPLEEHEDAWGVRFTSGPFPETTVVFGAIGFNKVKDNLTFNFEIKESPDQELTEDDEELQQHCAKVLEAIIVAGVEDGTVELKDPDASES